MNAKAILFFFAIVSCILIFEASAKSDICDLPLYTGPCRAYMKRYGYEPSVGNCKQFIYGGCHGNENNFATKKECEHVCGH